ncbi:MAG: ATP-binding protein [Ignavibacteria bacterium]|nr:ATP-binding protein [Ignavibacteria bacterium]
MSQKPDLPFSYTNSNEKIVVSENYSSAIKENAVINSIDGIVITEQSFLEPYLDTKSIGDEVTLSVGGVTERVRLNYAYDDSMFIIISVLVAASMYLFSILLIIKKPDDVQAVILYLMFNLFALAVCSSPGKIAGNAYELALAVRIVHIFAYLFGIALLLHFAFVFPSGRFRRKNLWLLALYLLFSVFCIIMINSQVALMKNVSNETASSYHTDWNILLLILMASIVFAASLFFISFFRNNSDDKRKIQWVLFGIIFGVLPYIVLWQMPSLLNQPVILREEFAFGFLMLIPVTFSIGIVKHHLFNIEIIFRRSLIYSVLTFAIFGIYMLTVFVLSSVFVNLMGDSKVFFSFIAAIFISVFMNPLRVIIQKYVNKIFYREKYDFNISVNEFISKVRDYATISDLSSGVLTELNLIIPYLWSAFLVRSESGFNLRITHSVNADDKLKEEIIGLSAELRRVHEYESILAGDRDEDDSEIHAQMKKLKIGLIVPLKLEKDFVIGYLVFGNKLSGLKFSDPDLILIKTVSSAITIALNKLNVQEILLAREIEKDELEKINRLKSDFVSNVSHELKTPLTSIQMFVDTLIDRPELPVEKKEEYLRVISGEGERLHRLINSLLDFSRFERGNKEFSFEQVSIPDIMDYVLNTFEYQFRKYSASVTRKFSKEIPLIKGDPDAIAEVFINLLSNSLKYSKGNPVIEISIHSENNSLIVDVTDNGIGIPAEYREKIFEKFFRVKQTDNHTGGTGIGLTVVKEILDAHGAVIQVESEKGKGTTFKLIFKT